MICFLTSRTDIPELGVLDSSNSFVKELQNSFPDPCHALFICSDPDRWERTDYYAAYTRASFERSGFHFDSFRTLDSRNAEQAADLVWESNLLILSGGHVPTQNHFFRQIDLRDLLKDHSGVVIGISAGSMNSADTVYAIPELDGEAVDPDYQRFLPGLGLTATMLLPHWQVEKDAILDGLAVFGDIACPDSMENTFYAIPDGSYLYIRSGSEELRGEAYAISGGHITRLCDNGEKRRL